MTDRYIDYFEVLEYGDHFVEQSKSLIGATKLVNIDELRARVAAASGKVDAELQKAGIERSGLRGARGTTEEKTATARRELEKFWGYLNSLDEGAADRAAMFAGGKLGPLANLKPADVKGKVDAALRGFEAKANLAFPERDAWQTRLKKASGDLGSALAEKGGASAVSITATAGLTSAREGFLAFYTGVAKPLVRGVLNDLGRADDMALFFKDLQVNERSSPKKAEGEAPAEAEAEAPAEAEAEAEAEAPAEAEAEAPAEAEAKARAEAPADAPHKGEGES